jgi:putative addiction module component (TIGR02574 family)
MNSRLRALPLEERIKLVHHPLDTIAAEQAPLPLTDAQRKELDCRLDAYESDGNQGRLAADVLTDIHWNL